MKTKKTKNINVIKYATLAILVAGFYLGLLSIIGEGIVEKAIAVVLTALLVEKQVR